MLQSIFDFLSVSEVPQTSDVIFVFAGKPERKLVGLDLWKRGYALELILSVGRFEWRRFNDLGLKSDGGLRELVERTRPQDRHFFVRCDSSHISCALTRLGYFGTWSEAREFARIVVETGNRSVTIVSTSFHLRRARLVLRRALRQRSNVEIHCVAVPESAAYVQRSQLANSWPARWAVLQELGKYVVYLIVGF
jgi:hypothetical protein